MRYQLTHDGKVIVENGAVVYVDTVDAFQADAGRAVIGAPGLIYSGGAGCVITRDGNQGPHGLSAGQVAAVNELIATAAGIVAARDARLQNERQQALSAALSLMGVEQRRAYEYQKAGATESALVVALWEYAVEGRADAVDSLQAARLQVKQAFPK